MNAARPQVGRFPRRVALLLVALAAGVAGQAHGAEPPGPVPLLQAARSADAPPRPAAPAGLGDWRLVAALGATFAVLLAVRFAARQRVAPPPPDVFEVLGTASLGGHHAVRIVRFGPKTLLVGVSAAGATTLAEIADPQATACIAAACRAERVPVRPAARARATEPRSAAAKEVA
jgi:flagellar biogenesis protein FliO